MDSSEDEGYFSESCFREPICTAAAPSCMVHVQRHALHSDDDRRSERSVAREQLVLSHWRELLYALAAKSRASSTEAAASTKAEPPAKAPAAAVMPPPPPPPQQQKRRVKKVKWVWVEKKTSQDDDPDMVGQLELCMSDVKTHVKTSQQSPVVRSS